MKTPTPLSIIISFVFISNFSYAQNINDSVRMNDTIKVAIRNLNSRPVKIDVPLVKGEKYIYFDSRTVNYYIVYYEKLFRNEIVTLRRRGLFEKFLVDDSNRVITRYEFEFGIESDSNIFGTIGDSMRVPNVFSFHDDSVYFPHLSKAHYLVELKNGNYVEYYLNGGVKVKGRYINNFKCGKWYYYSENGTLLKKEIYRKGRNVRVVEVVAN